MKDMKHPMACDNSGCDEDCKTCRHEDIHEHIISCLEFTIMCPRCKPLRKIIFLSEDEMQL